MDKKRDYRVKYLWYFLAVFVIVILVVFLKTESTPTGFFVYEETLEKNWNFDTPSDYVYDDSLVNLSDQEAKLVPTTIINTWTTEETSEARVTSSTLNNPGETPHDKTAEVQTIDGEFVNLNKANSLLDVTFDNSLDNGDVVSIYILQGNNVETDVYLCDENTACDSPGYGLVEFDGDEGWYNITISGLSSPKTTFAVDPPNHIKIDYVKATYTETVQHSSTNITYPASAEVETNDFQPDDLKSWETLTVDETLNAQNIDYQYSLDSGVTWTDLPGGDLSLVDASSGKIRFKAVLNSNETETPILNSLSLSYIIQVCNENWTASFGDCLVNDVQLKYYLDTNECGTRVNLPIDNGTYIPCDYCRPVWQEVNGSCWPGNTLISWFNDTKGCYNLTNLRSDKEVPANITYPCDYCTAYNCSGSDGVVLSIGNQTLTLDAVNQTHTFLEIKADQNLTDAKISIIEYSSNPQNITPAETPLERYIEIESTVKDISSAKITLYYTDEEIEAAGIDEATLKIHYYNETSQEWEDLDSTVNTTGNYVWALVSHFSLYGLFGEEVVETAAPATGSSGGGGGGGGGGGSRTKTRKEVSLPVKKIVGGSLETKTEEFPEAEQEIEALEGVACEYVLEVSLPEELSLVEEDSFQGEIVNKGNCDVQKLSLYLSLGLEAIVDLPITYFEEIKKGNKTKFILIRKSEKRESWFSLLTGNMITYLMTTETIKGALTIEGAGNQEPVFKKELPLNIKIVTATETAKVLEKVFPWLVILFVFLLFLVLLVLRRRKKKEKKKSRGKKKVSPK